eukprot:4058208-Alexandrium_andersonii.AAC.1
MNQLVGRPSTCSSTSSFIMYPSEAPPQVFQEVALKLEAGLSPSMRQGLQSDKQHMPTMALAKGGEGGTTHRLQ